MIILFRFLVLFFLSGCLVGCSDKKSSLSVEQLTNLQQAVETALLPLKAAQFLSAPMSDFSNVQSPFVPRVRVNQKFSPIQELSGLEWRWAGEVKENNELLGVFLASSHRTLYFGKNLLLADGLWQVAEITQDHIVFECLNPPTRWSLRYTHCT